MTEYLPICTKNTTFAAANHKIYALMSVKVTSISKSYGSQRVLDDVSFDIAAGEIIGFLGPNGAGKSTMMKIVTGYVNADSGHAEVCGYDVSRERDRIHQLIGYLPEHNPLYTDMYVREYLRMVAGLCHVGNANRKVDEMIEMTGLTPECHKRIAALSKGYRQRVGIAQALIGDPQVVVLDEPTTGLDPNQILEIRQLIKSIGRERTVMLSTHIMQEVEATCGKVIIIDHGQIKAEGRPEDIARQARGGVDIEVEFDREVDAEELQKIPFIYCVTPTGPRSAILRQEGDDDARPEIFRFAVRNGLIILRLLQIGSDMESIFHKLTLGDGAKC